MKLVVENINGIISGAHFKVNEHSLSLFINTEERWIEPDTSSWSSLSDDGDFSEKAWEFHVDDGDDLPKMDVVRLIAESKEEDGILRRLTFTAHCKDQLWYLLPKVGVYLDKEEE